MSETKFQMHKIKQNQIEEFSNILIGFLELVDASAMCILIFIRVLFISAIQDIKLNLKKGTNTTQGNFI